MYFESMLRWLGRRWLTTGRFSDADGKRLASLVAQRQRDVLSDTFDWHAFAGEHFPDCDPLDVWYHFDLLIKPTLETSSSTPPQPSSDRTSSTTISAAEDDAPTSLLHLTRRHEQNNRTSSLRSKASFQSIYFQWTCELDQSLIDMYMAGTSLRSLSTHFGIPTLLVHCRLLQLMRQTGTKKTGLSKSPMQRLIQHQYNIIGPDWMTLSSIFHESSAFLRNANIFKAQLQWQCREDRQNGLDRLLPVPSRYDVKKPSRWTTVETAKLLDTVHRVSAGGLYAHINWQEVSADVGRPAKTCQVTYEQLIRNATHAGKFSLEEGRALLKAFRENGRKWRLYRTAVPSRNSQRLRRHLLRLFYELYSGEGSGYVLCHEVGVTKDMIEKMLTANEKRWLHNLLAKGSKPLKARTRDQL